MTAEKTTERKAKARLEAPVDIGLLIQRTARMAEAALDQMEQEHIEFAAAGKGVPNGFVRQLKDLGATLNELSLAHKRYREAEDAWAENLSDEQSMENFALWLLAKHKDQPDLVRKWLQVTVNKINHAGDTVKGAIPKPVKRAWHEEYEGPGNDTWPAD